MRDGARRSGTGQGRARCVCIRVGSGRAGQGWAGYGTVEYCTVRCDVVRRGTVLCGRIRCGAVRGFAVRCVRFSSFGRLCFLISDNLSDHAFVLLVVELIYILFRKGLCQQVL